ncbi:MAG TPA: ABC transporter substrate-binding protein [Erysipelotrichaceae bacterium]|nr:ABC transporter substrate-binding protein [Erysipelotrichaceae bacterium]
MKKFKSFKVLLTLMLALVLVGCNGNGDSSSDDSIVFGFMGPLTGDYSIYGTTTKEGIDLALEEINASGGVLGKKLVLAPYDTKGDKTEAINSYNRLRDNDNMVALLGGTLSGDTLAIREIAIADGMPILTPTGTHLDITVNAPNILRACFTDPYQGETAAVFAGENLKAKDVAILYNTTDAYSEGLATSFENKFKEYGEVLNVEGYSQSDSDFRSILTRIEANNPDAIYLPEYYSKAGQILTQVRELGIEIPIIGPDGYDGIEEDYADVAEGVYFTNHFAKTDEAAIVKDFIENYSKKYGGSPTTFSALGYDSAYVMAEAIKNAGSTESSDLVNQLLKTEITGVTGNFVFSENGDPQKSISIIQIIDGQLVLIDKVTSKN